MGTHKYLLKKMENIQNLKVNAPGEYAGLYRKLMALGEGAYGEVWLVRKLGSKPAQVYAAKLLKKESGMYTEFNKASIKKEWDTAGSLDHENLLKH